MGGIDILCVEDDAGLRESLGQLIELEGDHPRLAGNGKEALELLQSGQKKPDLILLDWLMPVMNGADFLQARLKNSAIHSIPVVVMTGDSREVTPELFQQMKISGHLRKPFTAGELKSVIRKILGKSV
jgi:CheY-like chemotaxis protein